MANVTISFTNKKGGCGKSSSTFHIGGFFAKSGANTLLIDCDPQASLSQMFLGAEAVENLTEEETLVSLFDEERFPSSPETLIRSTAFERLQLIPANQALDRFNVPVPEETGLRQYALSTFLEEVEGFDIVLIDCPPNLYQCTWNALLASHFAVIPVPPEDPGAQGIPSVHQAIENARALNPALELAGHLVMRLDRRTLIHRIGEKSLRELHGETVFKTSIPEAVAMKVAVASRTPISHHAPSSKAGKDVREFSEELLARIQRAYRAKGVA